VQKKEGEAQLDYTNQRKRSYILEGARSKWTECPLVQKVLGSKENMVNRHITLQGKGGIDRRLHQLDNLFNQWFNGLLENHRLFKSRRSLIRGPYSLYLWKSWAQMSKMMSLAMFTRELRLAYYSSRFVNSLNTPLHNVHWLVVSSQHELHWLVAWPLVFASSSC